MRERKCRPHHSRPALLPLVLPPHRHLRLLQFPRVVLYKSAGEKRSGTGRLPLGGGFFHGRRSGDRRQAQQPQKVRTQKILSVLMTVSNFRRRYSAWAVVAAQESGVWNTIWNV